MEVTAGDHTSAARAASASLGKANPPQDSEQPELPQVQGETSAPQGLGSFHTGILLEDDDPPLKRVCK